MGRGEEMIEHRLGVKDGILDNLLATSALNREPLDN